MKFRCLAAAGVAMVASAALVAATQCAAAVRLPNIFGDHMVLQRSMRDPVWGWAAPGEKITVHFHGQTATTLANAHGQWSVRLEPMAADSVPHKLIVQGTNRVVVRDVLVGEVWLCGGQSNMEYPLHGWFRGGHMKRAVAGARHPLIRLMEVAHAFAGTPHRNCGGHWVRCSPATAKSFSAVAYFFGRDLHAKLRVPFGLILSDFGGTRIEPWTPELGFKISPLLNKDYLLLRREQAQLPRYHRQLRAYVKLAHRWVRQARAAMGAKRRIPAPPAAPVNPIAGNRNNPTPLFNDMINPLIPYGIRGAIWYQGENNVGESARQYYANLKALITSWRALWREGNFPFFIVQIAPYDYGRFSGRHDLEPEIWAAQQKAAATVPGSGIVGTLDIASPRQGHPVDKRDVGYRLSLLALAKVYGRKHMVWSGPVYQSMAVRGRTVVLHFRHVGGGLASRDGKPLTWFQIAGNNRHFVTGIAKIVGVTVHVHAAAVRHPAAVRFAYEDIATPNLMNKAGLPAMPFATARWARPGEMAGRLKRAPGGAAAPPPPRHP